MNKENIEIRHIVRLAGTDLEGEKVIERALLKIKGVGHMYANAIRKKLDYPKGKKIGELSIEETKKIEEIIKNPKKVGLPEFLFNRRRDPEKDGPAHLVSSDLEITHRFDIKNMQEIRSYKGIRHAYGLKVRGQRTRSTGRTGAAVGVKRKKIIAKMQKLSKLSSKTVEKKKAKTTSKEKKKSPVTKKKKGE
jgi:small subunit ribosomal protein S13